MLRLDLFGKEEIDWNMNSFMEKILFIIMDMEELEYLYPMDLHFKLSTFLKEKLVNDWKRLPNALLSEAELLEL
jgi:hypothetical protein